MNNKQSRHKKVFAFIDSQNLNMGVSSNIEHKGRKIYSGWKLDFKKFRIYLKDKFKAEEAFLFIGNKPGQESKYAYLQRCGYIVVLKPTTSYKDNDGNIKVKGNVDTDLVLYAAAKEINNYDEAIIVTGDGDFLSLCEYLDEQGKLGNIVIPNKHKFSQLLSKYAEKLDFVSVNRVKLEEFRVTKKTSIVLPDAHSKVARHGDKNNIPPRKKKVNQGKKK